MSVSESKPARRYFDNAATSFPKPAVVLEAMVRFATHIGSPGRGAYAEARQAAELVWRCRERLCRLFNGERPENVVFTLNTTDALNLAIKGAVGQRRASQPRRGVHVVTTWMEHNSVLRPTNALAEEGVEQTLVPADPATGVVDPDEVRRAIRPETVLVTVSHASNVTGTIQPVAEIGKACRAAGVMYLVDGAQSAGHLPIDVRAMNIDLLAFPGHKGLMGPQGTGGLYLRPGMEERVRTVREGGTGSSSEQDTQPRSMPDRYEAGSHNTMGIVGLSEAVGWILERGVAALRGHEERLMGVMLEGLLSEEAAPGLRLLGPTEVARRVGVFSVVHESLSPAELSGLLEEPFGVLTRAGLHCAPLAHRTLKTGGGEGAAAGATRLSVGPFLTEADVRYACGALGQICREHRGAPAGV